MKKQFITGVLLLAATAFGLSTFTSCKDTDEDLYNQLNSEQVSLRTLLNNLQDELKKLEGCPENCDKKIDSLKNELKELIDKKAQADQVYTKTEIDEKIDSLKNELKELINKKADASDSYEKEEIDDKIDSIKNELGSISENLDQKIDDLKEELTNLINEKGNGGDGYSNDEIDAKIDSLKTYLESLIGAKANADNVYTKTEIDNKIDSLLTELQSVYVSQAAYNAAMNGENGILARLAALEGKECPEPGDPQFTEEEVTTIKELMTILPQLKGLFGEDGVIAGIQSSISSIEDQLDGLFGDNGTLAQLQQSIDGLDGILNGANGQPGLVSQVADLSKWFEGKNWTVTAFQDAVEQGMWVSTNHAALQALVDLKDKLDENALVELNKYYLDFEGIDKMYNKIWKNAQLPEGAEDWWNYGEVMQNIMDNSAAIATLQDDFSKLVNRLNDMVTSLVLQATTNPVFGSFNSPFGINSMVLMTVYGDLATNVREFPTSGVSAECYSAENDDIDWSALVSEPYVIESKQLVALNEDKQASLGNLWFTVNPGTINNLDVNGFSIVNSIENDVVKVTNVTKDDETVLKFGVGARAAGNGNGLYKGEVSVNPDDLDLIKVHIESGLAQSLKNAVKNRTASDMVQMFKAIYGQLQDVCDANALRYTYKAATGKDAAGKWVETDQKVYSNYGMAATAFKPLSYATLKGTSIRHLPTIGSIEISKDLVNLNLKPFTIGNVQLNINLAIESIQIDPVGDTWIKVKIPKKYDVTVGHDGSGSAVLPPNWENDPKLYDTISVNIKGDLQGVVDKIQKSIDDWIKGVPGNENKPGLNEQINKAIKNAVDEAFNNPETGLVPKLENQVNDMMGSIQDKLYSLMDKINNEYLGKVNSLINKYNTVAERINNVLDDPNHYLQSVMLYRKAGKLGLNGGTPEVELPFGILSTDPKLPTQFKGDGEAISLWATSYTFETVAPAFKKCVAVVSVKDQDGNLREDLVNDANKTLAKVMNGDQTRVALNVKNAKGGTFTYEVAFQALDYTGHTSTVKCYLQVVR